MKFKISFEFLRFFSICFELENIKYNKTKISFSLDTFSVIFEKKKSKLYIRGSLNRFPDIFRMGTSIDSTHMKFKSPSN